MATWVTQVTDSFTRANETPLAGSWTSPITAETAVNLTTNQVVPSSLANDCSARYSGRAWANDQSSSAIFTSTGTSGQDGTGLAVRAASGARTYYRFTVNHASSPNAEIRRFLAGVSAQLDSWDLTAFSDGDRFTFRVSGPQTAAFLEVLRNGVSVRTFTDNSTIASGSPGLAYSSTLTGATWDDWEGGELVADAAVQVPVTYPPRKFGPF